MAVGNAWQRKERLDILEKEGIILWRKPLRREEDGNAIESTEEWQQRERLASTVATQVGVDTKLFEGKKRRAWEIFSLMFLWSLYTDITLSVKPLFTIYLKYQFAPSLLPFYFSPWQLHYQIYSVLVNLLIYLLSVTSQ